MSRPEPTNRYSFEHEGGHTIDVVYWSDDVATAFCFDCGNWGQGSWSDEALDQIQHDYITEAPIHRKLRWPEDSGETTP
jgi:hypothetical protein